MSNPLLENYDLPPFGSIKPEYIEPAIDRILSDNRKAIEDILKDNTDYSWDNLQHPLEELDDRLNRAWSPVSHLHSVADNEELRQAYNKCLPKLTAYNTELGQNEGLYRAYNQVAGGKEFDRLSQPQKMVIKHTLRDFQLSGIGLNEEDKAEFKQLKQRLSELQTKFEENLLDATQAWTIFFENRDRLKGLPGTALAFAAQNARQKEKNGWLFTLDFPSYYPVMQYAQDRKLREEMYYAYATRASELGPNAGQWDNSNLILEIISLRKQMAQLLDFKTYAEQSLVKKMATAPGEVTGFLNDLATKSKPVAQREYEELRQFAEQNYGMKQLQAWDIAYYSELLRQYKFNISQEELRPYFPVTKVIDGMFKIVHLLYGLDIKRRQGIDGWHPDVRFFDIYDEDNTLRGSFYLDLYARQGKRGGAWMDECRVRKHYMDISQIPVAYLTCNFTPPVDNDPSLLTHDEVITLFHEFGHGLHHMLTRVDYPEVAGINGVPWDAVELPSQFMENWCWEREPLDLIAGHYKTGEPLPGDLFNKMVAAKTFQSGMQMLRQLEFALFDFHLHYDYEVAGIESIQSLLDDIRKQVAVVLPPEYNRFQHSFSHIFAGGYAAGYYSYKWAEVLSADAFSKFEENGIFDRETGRQFLKSILEQGGSRDPMDLFIEFRGRKPSIDALLRHSGIVTDDNIVTA